MVGELKFQIPQGDPLRRSAQAEGGPEAGETGGEGHGLIPEDGGHRPLPGQNAPGPLGGQPGEGLEVGQGVLQTAPHAPQQDEAAEAPVQTLPQGVHHVGVVLGRGELDHVRVAGPPAQGVKVPHHQVGGHAVGLQSLIPLVGGNDKVLCPRVGTQGPGQGHGPHYIADRPFQERSPLSTAGPWGGPAQKSLWAPL